MDQNSDERFQIPWFKEGLRFSCTQCGKCCTGSPGYVWASEDEIIQMAEFLKLSTKDFKRLYMRRVEQRWTLVERKSQNHNCIFYDNQKCRVYAARPLQCRAYPFWQENLLSEASWKTAAEECEGINLDSPVISSDLIEKFLEEQRNQGPEEHFVSCVDK